MTFKIIQNLILINALGPTSVPYNPVHILNLAKHIHRKVFDDIYQNPDKPFVNLTIQVVCCGSDLSF